MSATLTPSWQSRQVLVWLSVAVLLHALLLLIPLRTETRVVQPATVLEVLLSPSRAAENPSLLEPVTRKEARVQALEPLPSLPEFVVPDEPVPAEPDPAKDPMEMPRLSTATLIRSAQDLKLDIPEPAQARNLGIHRKQDLPANWKPGAGAEALLPEANRFGELYAPAKVEIVDRWLAADGSHNVVVNLPNGDTLCGRAQAWNPMQPLVEHVMMFRNCGGGGKRTFEMSIPETPHDSFLK